MQPAAAPRGGKSYAPGGSAVIFPSNERFGAAGGTSAAMRVGFFAIIPANFALFIVKVHTLNARLAPAGPSWGGRRHIGGDGSH